MNRLGRRLREQRIYLSLSQAQMALIGGVGPCAQWQMESGNRLPKADYLFKFATAGVDIANVITGVHESKRVTIASTQASPGNHREVNRREMVLTKAMFELTRSWLITLTVLTELALLAESRISGLIPDKVGRQWELNREQLCKRMIHIVSDINGL